MKKKVTTGEVNKVHEKIAAAFHMIAEPVGTTLGPGGKNVLLKNFTGTPMITKDGVTVARSISLEDEEQDLIASIIKEAAEKTNKEAGDGTTSATVLAYEIFKEGAKLAAAGHRPVQLQRGILEGITKVSAELDSKATKVDQTDLDILKKVATISMNGDEETAELVAKAVSAVGVTGSVTVQSSRSGNKWYREEGVRINRGWVNPSFKEDPNSTKQVLEDCYILITSHDLQSPGQLADLGEALNPLAVKQKPVLIISSGMGASFLYSLMSNFKNGVLKSCPILPPYFGVVRREFFHDLAALTGATVIDKDEGHELAAVKLEHLGRASKVEVTAHETIIIGGQGKPEQLEKRKEALKTQLKNLKDLKDLDKVAERYAKLSGGIGIIELAHFSDVELEEKKHRVEDAANACKAALEEGFVSGGGSALYRAASKVLNTDIPGEGILLKACYNLIKRMGDNTGVSGEVIANQVKNWGQEGFAVDLRNGTLVDAVKTGILDPAKVVKASLANGGSVAAALLTTGAIVSDIPVQSNSFLEPYSG